MCIRDSGFVVEKSQKFCAEGKFKQMNAILWVCPVLFGLCAALPVFVLSLIHI